MADPSGAIATWTVVFTDLVGSTAWRIRVGETSFDLTRQDLDRRISEVLAEHGPAVVKSTGDGVMAGFGSTASALRCAVAIQQAIDTRNQAARSIEGEEPALLRIGISVGDAVEEEGDLHGTAVVEASRLCDVAGAGAILCTGAVRTVSANRSGCRFGPSQTVELKGIPGPISVHEVLWTDLPAPGRPLTFRVLGPLAVDLDGAPVPVGGPKEQQVLALLLCRAGTAVPVDVLVDELWPDVPPRTAERTVHAYIARLRKALPGGKDLLTTVGRGYRLAADPMQLDATRFEAQARTGRERLTDGDAAGAVASLASALGEWTGPAYGEFLESPACAAEAERLAGLRLTALEDRIEAELATGAAAELVGELESLVRDHPFRERLWGHLLLALYRAGRQRDALDAYQRARSVLVDELGIEPGPELRRLEAAILDQDASLDRTSRAAPAPPPGFPLLLEAVGPAFLGRGAELDRLRGMWAEAVDGHGAFVSILGPEGMGKTRLVAEIAREASDGGGAVLYGRCDHSHRGATSL
ncbi:MAG TPA: BTAD domain-containing putative transcriptional regulator, partial [Acidimicrobiales bacterium]|nr:BTAD domain-containing putative transcriptional regulator [Acidimicrobiales bacterium]